MFRIIETVKLFYFHITVKSTFPNQIFFLITICNVHNLGNDMQYQINFNGRNFQMSYPTVTHEDVNKNLFNGINASMTSGSSRLRKNLHFLHLNTKTVLSECRHFMLTSNVK